MVVVVVEGKRKEIRNQPEKIENDTNRRK